MGDFDGYEDQLRVQTLPTDTEREELDVITNGLAVGMARFALEGGFTGLVTLQAAEGIAFDIILDDVGRYLADSNGEIDVAGALSLNPDRPFIQITGEGSDLARAHTCLS